MALERRNSKGTNCLVKPTSDINQKLTVPQLSALPVVSTRHGGIPDVVVEGETGLLVDEQDVPGMAKAMLRLAEDPLLAQRYGLAGRQRALAHFSLDACFTRLQQVLQSCAGTEAPR